MSRASLGSPALRAASARSRLTGLLVAERSGPNDPDDDLADVDRPAGCEAQVPDRVRGPGAARGCGSHLCQTTRIVSYQTAVSGWHDFYVVAGTASATLVGLLFVGLSLHLRVVLASSDVRGLARVTLTNFATILLVAMFMVIPQDQSSAAFEMIGTSAISLVINAPSLVAAVRSHQRTLPLTRLALRFGLSTLSYLGLVLAGIQLLSAYSAAFNTLVTVNVILLVISLRNTWDLLVTVGEVTPGAGQEAD